jgi:type II secretion system protein G
MQIDHRRGMTLVEILVVVAIIGMLTSLAIPAFMQSRKAWEIAHAKNEVRLLSIVVEQLSFDTQQWPGGIKAGITTDSSEWHLNSPRAGLVANDGRFTRWKGPYMEPIDLDPWGGRYFFDAGYMVDSNACAVVGSLGPNRGGRSEHDEDNIYALVE